MNTNLTGRFPETSTSDTHREALRQNSPPPTQTSFVRRVEEVEVTIELEFGDSDDE